MTRRVRNRIGAEDSAISSKIDWGRAEVLNRRTRQDGNQVIQSARRAAKA